MFLGKKADCDRCGCIIPFLAEMGRNKTGTFISRVKAQYAGIMGMYSPYFKERPLAGFR